MTTKQIKPDYSHKPKSLNSIQDLIDFLTPIPPKFWCVDNRALVDDNIVRHCVLGHLDAAYGYFVGDREAAKLLGSQQEAENCLARVNNGESDYCNSGYRMTHNGKPVSLTGAAAKSRVLRFLRAAQKGQRIYRPTSAPTS